MVDPKRSPFGELVRAHRRRLGLRQIGVANEAMDVSKEVFHGQPISERTINAWERRTDDPAKWTGPQQSMLRTLVGVLEIEEGSEEERTLHDAARDVRQAVEQASAEPSGIDTPDGEPASPFVAEGREPHLDRLHRAIDDVSAGSPGVVLISADPGTGKSWLLEDVCRNASERHGELVTLWANCTRQLGVADSHPPFRQLLGRMVGDFEAASRQELVSPINEARLNARIPASVRAVDSGGRGVIPRFLSTESLRNANLASITDSELQQTVRSLIQSAAEPAMPAPEAHEQLFRMLARYAEAGPVILALEDLHWADSGTISALSHVVRRLHQQRLPILILGSFRPAGLSAAPSGGGHPLPSVLYDLPRLFPDSILDLSTAVGGVPGRAFIDAIITRSMTTVPPEMAASLFAKTAGLPLFVTSILRLYKQDQDHDAHPGSVDSSDLARIPDEIKTVFAEQVERLPSPDLQHLLAVASVQGNDFSAETLMQILEIPRIRLIEMLDQQLVRSFRLLSPGGGSMIAGQPVHEYQFSHALLRDYIHDGLTPLERTQYHAATADALLALYGERDHDATDAIAFHLDGANDRARAAVAYLHAGDHAMHHRDFDRAIQHFSRIEALRIRRSHPETFIMALIGRGNCARGRSEPAHARALLRKALDLAKHHELPVVEAHVLETIALLDFDAGEMQAGADRLASVIDLWLSIGDDNAGRAMANLGYLLYGLGRYNEAAAFAERGGTLARRLGNDRMWVDARIALANCRVDIGLYENAIATYNECLAVCEELHDAHRQHLCWLNIGQCSFELERWNVARDAIERVLRSESEIAAHIIGVAEFALGVIAEGQGDMTNALAHYDASREIRETLGQHALLVDSLAGLLRVAVTQHDDARMESLRADIHRRIDERGLDGIEHAGRLFVTLIESSLSLNEESSAREYVRHATALLTERADRLADPAHRESYLANVPAHRRVFETAESMEIR